MRKKDRFERALQQKIKERDARGKDARSVDYRGDAWVKEQVELLEKQIAEMHRYKAEGGKLSLPRCCKDDSVICLLAVTKFDHCFLHQRQCGFSWREGDGV
jgi:hypothetical protein